MKPRVVLCAVDFSLSARVALEEAVVVARERGAHLVLVHVVEMTWALVQSPMGLCDLLERAVVELTSQLDGWRRDAVTLGAGDVRARVLQGVPWQGICEMARALDADLVILGSRCRRGLGDMLLGSVAEKVLRHAPCSVLVARQPPTAARAAA